MTLTDTATPHAQRGAYACTSGAPPRAPPPARRGRAPPRLEPRACTRPRGMMSGQSGSRRSAWPLLPWLDDDHRTRLVCRSAGGDPPWPLATCTLKTRCLYGGTRVGTRRCSLTRLASSLPCRHGSQTAAPGRARHGSSGHALRRLDSGPANSRLFITVAVLR